MRNIKIILAYDGTDFNGWQVQKTGRTVQNEIEEALHRIHGHRVNVQGAGRTDSGVHASGQVANFYSDIYSIPDFKYKDALNSYLPRDVRILNSREVDRSFNAKNSALLRIYRYNIYPAAVGLPHLRRICWKIKKCPDIKKLNRMAAKINGEQDFSVFSAAGDSSVSKVRKIYSACFFPAMPFIVFRIAASSFLWKMVRSIVGTIIELERNNFDDREFSEIIQSRDRSRVGTTAPSRGLFLERVHYDKTEFPC